MATNENADATTKSDPRCVPVLSCRIADAVEALREDARVTRLADMDRWTLSDWDEWNAEQDAHLDPEWVRKYGRQSFEAVLALFGFGSLLEGRSWSS